jgi:hypothetical protein
VWLKREWNAMSSSLPSEPEERRIVPFRPAHHTAKTLPSVAALSATLTPASASASGTTSQSPAVSSAAGSAGISTSGAHKDAARHYLKFMLPSIPVVAFVATFVACYLMQGAAATQSTEPTVPFLAALLLGAITGALCVTIYFGYVRISMAEAHDGASQHPRLRRAGRPRSPSVR